MNGLKVLIYDPNSPDEVRAVDHCHVLAKRIKATRDEVRGLLDLHCISGAVAHRLNRTLDGLAPIESEEPK